MWKSLKSHRQILDQLSILKDKRISLQCYCESSVFSLLRIFSKICPASLNNPLKQYAFPLVCITGLATFSHLYVKLIFSHERKWGKEREGWRWKCTAWKQMVLALFGAFRHEIMDYGKIFYKHRQIIPLKTARPPLKK